MNIIDTINNLWHLTYGIIVGWGASFTIIVTLLVILGLRVIRMNHTINRLESRIVTAEREINLAISKIK
jgi:hypothetical protein